MTIQKYKNKPKNKPSARKQKQPSEPAKPKAKVLQSLAAHFEEDLKKTLPISIQPDGSIVYKQYLVKQTTSKSWGVYNIHSHDLVEIFYLKTSALMAAKAYASTHIEKFFEIKRLDSRYWANYMESEHSRHNLQSAVDLSHYIILLNKFENSQYETDHYKDAISKMFRWSFV
jgi:hypothetical protein